MLTSLTTLYLIGSLTSTAAMAIFTVVLFLFFLFELFAKKISFKELLIPGYELLVAFFICTLISYFVNFNSNPPLRESFVDLRWILSIYAIQFAFKNYKITKKHFNYLLIALCLLSVYNLIQSLSGFDLKNFQVLTNQESGVYRAVGFFNSPMTFANVWGAAAAIITALAIYEAFNKRKFMNIYLLASSMAILSVIVSLTRGAWIGLLVAIYFAIFISNKKRFLKFVLASIFFIGTLSYFYPPFKNRVSSIVDIENKKNLGRQVIWKLNWEVFNDNPVFGVGAGMSGVKASEYATDSEISLYPIKTHAHNQILDVLVTRGIPGGLIFLMIFIFYIRLGIKLYRSNNLSDAHKALALGASSGLVFLLASGLTEANIEDNEVTNIFVICISLLVWISNTKNNLEKTKLN